MTSTLARAVAACPRRSRGRDDLSRGLGLQDPGDGHARETGRGVRIRPDAVLEELPELPRLVDCAEVGLVWRELQSRYGVVDVASVVFRDQHGIWSFLDLWRDTAAGTFGRADVDRLAELAEPVTAAFRRCLATTAALGP